MDNHVRSYAFQPSPRLLLNLPNYVLRTFYMLDIKTILGKIKYKSALPLYVMIGFPLVGKTIHLFDNTFQISMQIFVPTN